RHSRTPDRAPARNMPDRSPPAAQPATPPPAEEPAMPDAEAILARLRQRRARDEPAAPARPQTAAAGTPPPEPRFQPGDRIICMPYGAGQVRFSMINGDREILLVEFDEHGELRIDPSVSVVRRLPPEESEQSE
ncbi:MAG: helicase, partial [Chloroflexus sp.]|nr:helicase [Chloroflexus sp.]